MYPPFSATIEMGLFPSNNVGFSHLYIYRYIDRNEITQEGADGFRIFLHQSIGDENAIMLTISMIDGELLKNR